ncbi:MAG: mechanosensitive ion channel [Gammaproteobacteria bacterium]|nr:mechanosensitive ion channel [Gammaproteobacteria bacterium]
MSLSDSRQSRIFSKTAIAIVMSLLSAAFALTALAESGSSIDNSREYSKILDKIEYNLNRNRLNEENLPDAIKSVSPLKSESTDCVETQSKRLEQLKSDLSTLGEKTKNETSEVKKKRSELNNDIASTEKYLASCRVFILRSDEIMQRLSATQQELLAARLLAQGADIKTLLQENLNKPGVFFKSVSSFLTSNSGIELMTIPLIAGLTVLLSVAVFIGRSLRRKLIRRIKRKNTPDSLLKHITCSLLSVLAHYMPHFLFSFSAAAFFYIVTAKVSPLPFISVVFFGLPIYLGLVAAVEIFLAPRQPAEPFHVIPEAASLALSRRLKVFLLLLFIGYMLFATLSVLSLPETVYLLSREIFAIVFVLNIIWAIWILGQIPRFENMIMTRFGLTFVLLSVLILELLGYRNLINYIVLAISGSLLSTGFMLLVLRLTSELFEGLEKGGSKWQRKVRESLGVKSRKKLPEILWTKLLVMTALWSLLLVALLRLWGLSEAGFEQIKLIVLEGFTVGSLQIIPARILLAIVALTLLLAFSSWVRTRLEHSWLSRTGIERGAREATATISGYIGVALALIISLSIAGVEFGNLAIIAGALSVGIGFGLQNIVNNFVSGLILLFERPIKKGDWIIVGQTEGFVKQISIRSTQIETFDRADVIVPNSELISGQVTNWMLKNVRGRIRIPIGVAYGSDTALVNKLLLEIARNNPYVVRDADSPEPVVLFMAFGDSALLFELRVFIYNIDRKFQALSDINFAIDAAFREHHIEIPFPQRDVHIKTGQVAGHSEIKRRDD